ncbi:Protein phosphatase 2C 7 mitochondrial [Spathaspora sp. JA1]|nr:Protein phosphatase 2C 7 mitochondrial [Spathaspora sp. JA1]
MLLSLVVKRGVPIGSVTTQIGLKSSTILAKRSFNFSAWTSKSGGNSNSGGSSKSYSQSTSSSSTSTGSANASSAAASSTGLNYETAFTSTLNYNIAVAYQPKEREEKNLFKGNNNKQLSPACQSATGEDNLFVSKLTEDGYLAVGVADGVGGWSEAGYDSSAISRELCCSIRSHFENNNQDKSPKQLLSVAFKEITESPKVEIGGTTACIGILSPDKQLQVANLGDSWCGVFRDFKLIHETNFQTHNFNTPYQLSKIPRHIQRQAEMEGRRYIVDTPDLADEYTWNLESGDLVMFATDGVTDNVIPQDIELFLKDQLEDNTNKLEEVATRFVKEVVTVSKDHNFPSAFAQELSKLTGQKYLGGKEDDITVVLIQVN